MKKNINVSENNGMWKGDQVGYGGVHAWVKRRLKKPKYCDNCLKVKSLDLANISQQYKRDLTDWEWLCRKCHMTKDGRLEQVRKDLLASLNLWTSEELKILEKYRPIYIIKNNLIPGRSEQALRAARHRGQVAGRVKSNFKRRAVIGTKNGVQIRFDSAVEATKFLGLSSSSGIGNIINKKGRKSGGYSWEYAPEATY